MAAGLTPLSPALWGDVSGQLKESNAPSLRIPQTYGSPWRQGRAERLAVAAVALAGLHGSAACEGPGPCWGHMLAGSALRCLLLGLPYSNGNSAICSWTARGQMMCLLLTGTSFHETLISGHLSTGKSATPRAPQCSLGLRPRRTPQVARQHPVHRAPSRAVLRAFSCRGEAF